MEQTRACGDLDIRIRTGLSDDELWAMKRPPEARSNVLELAW
jgi:hypothetical protein